MPGATLHACAYSQLHGQAVAACTWGLAPLPANTAFLPALVPLLRLLLCLLLRLLLRVLLRLLPLLLLLHHHS